MQLTAAQKAARCLLASLLADRTLPMQMQQADAVWHSAPDCAWQGGKALLRSHPPPGVHGVCIKVALGLCTCSTSPWVKNMQMT